MFQRLQKIALARRASAIGSLWKIYKCLFIPNWIRKIIWLLVNNIHATISVTLQYVTWQMKGQATSTLLDENLTCEFKRKNSFTLSKSCMKTEQFLCCLWKAVFIHIWIQEPDQKGKENFPVVLMRPSLKLFFEWLKKTVPCSSLSSRRNSSTNTSCSNQNAEKQS